jgi:hypothetical protein
VQPLQQGVLGLVLSLSRSGAWIRRHAELGAQRAPACAEFDAVAPGRDARRGKIHILLTFATGNLLGRRAAHIPYEAVESGFRGRLRLVVLVLRIGGRSRGRERFAQRNGALAANRRAGVWRVRGRILLLALEAAQLGA